MSAPTHEGPGRFWQRLFHGVRRLYARSDWPDFLGAASKVAERDGRLVEMYTFAAVVYFIISLAASRTVAHLQRRIAIIR